MIALGSKCRDKVTGFEGIAVARTSWLTGCDRYTLQPQGLVKGASLPTETFDENTLEVVRTPQQTKVANAPAAVPGGPRPEPARRK